MATEEIEISELEFTEELAPDNLIPVESSTDTKATSLQKIKEWLSSFFVGKTGNELINGIKSFNSDVYIVNRKSLIINSSNLDNKNLGDWKGDLTLYHTDKNGERVLGVYATQTEKGNVCQLIAYDPTNEGTYRASTLSIVYEKEGYTYAIAPTPATGDNSTKIATTAWVNNAGAVVTSKSFGANGYVKYSSGLIIQWGSVGLGVNNITFPTAFSNKNAIVCPVAYYNSASQIAYYDLTTTGCAIYPNRSDYSVRWFAIGY